MKKIIEYTFKNFNFYFFTPKIDTFGGYVYYFFWFKKIINKKKIKKIVIIYLFDPISNKYFKSNFKLKMKYKLIYLKKLNFLEKTLSFLFSVIINLNLIAFKFFTLGRLKKIYLTSLGYTDRLADNFSYFDITDVESLNEIRTNYNELNFKNYQLNENNIVLCVKDKNYGKFLKKISDIACADINKYSNAIKLLTSKYNVVRVGDPSNVEFKFNFKNFSDLTKDKNYFDKMLQTFYSSSFYFGTGGSQSCVALCSKSKRFISNSIDFLGLESSFSNSDFCIFKNIFYIKENKILSLNDIYNEGHVFRIFKYPKDYLIIDNSDDEIEDLAKILISQEKEKFINNDLLEKFYKLRFESFKKFNLKNENDYNKQILKAYFNIPKSFLEKNFEYNDYLEKKTNSFIKNSFEKY